MRVLTGRLSATDFVAWLAEPEVTDLSRLAKILTYTEPDVEPPASKDNHDSSAPRL